MKDNSVKLGGTPELGTYQMIQRMANDIELLKAKVSALSINYNSSNSSGTTGELLTVGGIGKGTDVTNYGNGLTPKFFSVYPTYILESASADGNYLMTDFIPVEKGDVIVFSGWRTPGDPDDESIDGIPCVVGYGSSLPNNFAVLLGDEQLGRYTSYVVGNYQNKRQGVVEITDNAIMHVRCAGRKKGYMGATIDMKVILVKKANRLQTASEVVQLVNETISQNAAQYPLKPVDVLPTANEANTNKAFVIPNDSDNTISDMWVVKKVGEGLEATYSWQKVGTLGANLSNYYTKGEVDAKTNGKYSMPEEGIPSTDLTLSVQTLLEKAETAYQMPQEGIPGSDLDEEIKASLDKANSALQGITQEEFDEIFADW